MSSCGATGHWGWAIYDIRVAIMHPLNVATVGHQKPDNMAT